MTPAYDLSLLIAAAHAGGKAALAYYRAGDTTSAGIRHKEGGSPVSEADLAANEAVARLLRPARPGYGWLSEETPDDRTRLGDTPCFVVDPIDGTRAFIAGRDDWCVALAVVAGGRPVAGVLYRPATGLTLSASRGEGAFAGECRLPGGTPGPAIRAAGPKPLLDRLERAVAGPVERRPRIASLALRLAAVATGELDIAFASDGAHDWDIAAADIILAEAGCLLAGGDGAALAYGRESIRRPDMVASGADRRAAALAALNPSAGR
jgi:myo-inositol-1(or 4)-monophosphatase